MSLRGFLFRHFLWIIPLSDNRVVGSGSLGRIAHFMSPSLGSVRKLCWTGYFGLPISDLLGLPNLDLGRWCAIVSRCSCQLTCIPITALVAPTVSLGFILAPPPYRMVHAGSSDYKKKKKKNWFSKMANCRVGLSMDVGREIQNICVNPLQGHPVYKCERLFVDDLHV